MIKVLVLDTVIDRGGAETMIMNYMRNINRDKISLDKYWAKLFSFTRSNYINGIIRVLINITVLAIVLIIHKNIRNIRLIKNEKNNLN